MEDKGRSSWITRVSRSHFTALIIARHSASRWTPWLVDCHDAGISILIRRNSRVQTWGDGNLVPSGSSASARGLAEEVRRRVRALRHT